MLAAGAAFATMGVLVKLGAQWFSSHELVFYRSLVGFLLLALLVGHKHVVPARNLIGLHFKRSVVGFLALAAFFYAVAHLPLSLAITLNYASPLFLAWLMPSLLGERPSRAQRLTVAVGFLGVVLMLRPWQAAPGDLAAGLIGLFSGLMAALAYVYVRRLGRAGEPEWRTVFWYSLFSSFCAGLLAGLDGWHAPGGHVSLLLGIGVLATIGQLGMTRAYRLGETAVVAAFAYSTVVFGGMLDTLYFGVDLPAIAWAGMVITVLAGVRAAQLTRSSP